VIRALLLLLLLTALGGCATSGGVKPWDRDLMAKPEMSLRPSPQDADFDDHIYFSKEGSTGGQAVGGGGCGCN
jgi:hypothetical protein